MNLWRRKSRGVNPGDGLTLHDSLQYKLKRGGKGTGTASAPLTVVTNWNTGLKI